MSKRQEQLQTPVGEIANISNDRIEIIKQALASKLLAHSGLDFAERHYEELEAQAALIDENKDKAKGDVELSRHRAEGADSSVREALDFGGVFKKGIDKRVLDQWFSYRKALHWQTVRNTTESRELMDRDAADRKALELMVPGTKVINLRSTLDRTPTADVIASLPRLEVVHDQTLGLEVIVETTGTRANDGDPSERQRRASSRGLRRNLDGLSGRLLVGEAAIEDYFDEYEPPILDLEDSRSVYEAYKSSRYINALREHGLEEDCNIPIDRMITALRANCRIALGVREEGTLSGLKDERAAKTLIKDLQQFDPADYQKVYDTVAVQLAGGYRSPESYSNIFAQLERGVDNEYRLGLEEKAATLTALKQRGAELMTPAST